MSIEMHLETPLAAAVRKAGSQSAFGRIIGRRQSTVRGWLVDGKALPAEHVLTVEAKLGIPRHILRPDIYPIEHSRLPISVAEQPLEANGVPVACNSEAVLQAVP